MSIQPAEPERPKLRMPRGLDTLFLAGGLGLLGYVVSRYPFAEVTRACIAVGPWAAVTILIALGWHACSARALYVLLERRVPWRSLMWARLSAEGYNALIFGVGGEPFRVRFLSRFVPSDQVVAALIRDRVLDMASGYLVSGAFLIVGVARFAVPLAVRASMTIYAAATLAIAVGSTALVLTRLPTRVGGRVMRWLGAKVAGEQATLSLGLFARVTPWYFGARVLGLAEIGVLMWLLGLGVDPVRIGFIDASLNAAGTLAFMVPQAVGVFEGTSVFLFKMFGYAGEAGIVFALVRRARMLLVMSFGLLLHWLGRDWRKTTPQR